MFLMVSLFNHFTVKQSCIVTKTSFVDNVCHCGILKIMIPKFRDGVKLLMQGLRYFNTMFNVSEVSSIFFCLVSNYRLSEARHNC